MAQQIQRGEVIFRGAIFPFTAGMFVVLGAFSLTLQIIKYGLVFNREFLIRRLLYLVLYAAVCGTLVSTFLTYSLSTEGVQGFSVWGAVRFIRWSEIQDARVFWFLNLKYVRLRSSADGRITWVLLSLRDLERFRELVRQYGGSDCQILRFIQ